MCVNAFLIEKMGTMSMKGGNTDQLYKGDGRLAMARALERVWPGVVSVKRRFKRPQHVINWRKFDTKLLLAPGVPATLPPNEYGLALMPSKRSTHKRGPEGDISRPKATLDVK